VKKAKVKEFQKALEDSGAVVRGDGFTFLKVVNNKTSKD
jgi:superoxide dismutase